ncbi:MAG: hypothetical protein KHY31_15920 [Clostridiales bacterium]|nr:hypothetical protein [Clostridiales bacterium]
MNQKEKQMVEQIMDTEAIGYAYLYPTGGGQRKEYLISTTPENLANFVGSHFMDAQQMIVTDMLDRLILDTTGGFLNRCPDQNLCREILKTLAPIQMGEAEPGEILAVGRDAADEYFREEDQAVTMAELSMQ